MDIFAGEEEDTLEGLQAKHRWEVGDFVTVYSQGLPSVCSVCHIILDLIVVMKLLYMH